MGALGRTRTGLRKQFTASAPDIVDAVRRCVRSNEIGAKAQRRVARFQILLTCQGGIT
jgi:hypothetical protein